jgi:hypothetical protein
LADPHTDNWVAKLNGALLSSCTVAFFHGGRSPEACSIRVIAAFNHGTSSQPTSHRSRGPGSQVVIRSVRGFGSGPSTSAFMHREPRGGGPDSLLPSPAHGHEILTRSPVFNL